MNKKAFFMMLAIAFTLAACGSSGVNTFTVESGQTVKVDAKLNGKALFGKGWSGQEPTHRWTDGKSAVLKIALKKKPQSAVVFSATGNGFLGKAAMKFQQITVKVNGVKTGVWKVAGLKKYTLSVPASAFRNTDMNVEFIIGKPLSPKEEKMSGDSRKLGFALRELSVKY